MPNCLLADSIRKSFDEKQVLTDIYLKCQTGDIVGLLGRNGSGKSTLLKIIFGTLHTDYKHITINGKVIDSPFEELGSISYLPQDDFLPKNLTVKKLITIFDSILNPDLLYQDQIVSKILETKIRNISGGELRYLEIILILNLDSQFVLLDEPFNGLSPLQIEIVKDLIKKTAIKKGIILTDHDYRNVLNVANKYMIIFDGGIKTLNSQEEFAYWGYLPDRKLK